MNRAHRRRVKSAPRNPTQSYSTLSVMGLPPIYRDTSAQGMLRRNKGYIYTCVRLISDAISAVPLRLFVRGGTRNFQTMGAGDTVEVVEHPSLTLLSSANPSMTGLELMRLTVQSLELLGNAYWYVESDSLGVPKNLWPLHAEYVKVVPDGNGLVVGYLYGTSDPQAFAQDEVIHFKYPNPAFEANGQFYGLAPLTAALHAADKLSAQHDYEESLYTNRARPDIAVIAKTGIPEDERERLEESWKSKFQGRLNAGKPAVFSGEIELKELNYAPTDTGIFDSIRLSREEILAVFGVPSQFMQISQSRAELESARFLFAQNTIEPKLRLIQATLNERFLTRYDESRRGYFAFDCTIPEDETTEANILSTLVKGGILVPDEARAVLGYEPVPGGAELRPQSGPQNGGNLG